MQMFTLCLLQLLYHLGRQVCEGRGHQRLSGALCPACRDEAGSTEALMSEAGELLQVFPLKPVTSAAGFLSLPEQEALRVPGCYPHPSEVHAHGCPRCNDMHTFRLGFIELSVFCSGTRGDEVGWGLTNYQPGHLGIVLSPFSPAPDHQTI